MGDGTNSRKIASKKITACYFNNFAKALGIPAATLLNKIDALVTAQVNSGKEPRCWYTAKQFEHDTTYSRNTFSRAVAKLVSYGLVKQVICESPYNPKATSCFELCVNLDDFYDPNYESLCTKLNTLCTKLNTLCTTEMHSDPYIIKRKRKSSRTALLTRPADSVAHLPTSSSNDDSMGSVGSATTLGESSSEPTGSPDLGDSSTVGGDSEITPQPTASALINEKNEEDEDNPASPFGDLVAQPPIPAPTKLGNLEGPEGKKRATRKAAAVASELLKVAGLEMRPTTAEVVKVRSLLKSYTVDELHALVEWTTQHPFFKRTPLLMRLKNDTVQEWVLSRGEKKYHGLALVVDENRDAVDGVEESPYVWG